MMRVWEYAKKHPFMIGGIVIFIFLLVLFLSSGGEESQIVQSGPSDAEIASNMQITQTQIAAGLQAAQLSAQKEVALAQIATQNKELDLTYNLRNTEMWNTSNLLARQMEIDHINYQTTSGAQYQLLNSSLWNAQIANDNQTKVALKSISAQKSSANLSSGLGFASSLVGAFL